MLLFVLVLLEFDVFFLFLPCDGKVCGRNQRALGMMAWDQFPPTGREPATKAKTITSFATGNYTSA
jgi:hypothetical protein